MNAQEGNAINTLAKVELTYEEGKGANITSEFVDKDGVLEFVLAGILIETIAVRHGMSIEEVSENILGSIRESEPTHFHISKELRGEAK